MTPIADMVRQMLEKGVAHEAIVMAVEGAEFALMSTPRPRDDRDYSVTDRDANRREVDRLRKQRWRDRHGLSRDNRDMSRDVTISSLSIESKKEEKEGRKRETARGSRLPVGWTPTDQDWAVGCELLGEQKAKSEIEKFRDHWAQQPGSRGIKLDWNAAWRNWARRAAEYAGAKNGRRTVQDAARELHETLVARANIFDEPAPQGLRSGASEDVVRLLPAGRRE